jgi:hypothetical protein
MEQRRAALVWQVFLPRILELGMAYWKRVDDCNCQHCPLPTIGDECINFPMGSSCTSYSSSDIDCLYKKRFEREELWRSLLGIETHRNNHRTPPFLDHVSPTTGANLTLRQRQALSILYTVNKFTFNMSVAIAWESCELANFIKFLSEGVNWNNFQEEVRIQRLQLSTAAYSSLDSSTVGNLRISRSKSPL